MRMGRNDYRRKEIASSRQVQILAEVVANIDKDLLMSIWLETVDFIDMCLLSNQCAIASKDKL